MAVMEVVAFASAWQHFVYQGTRGAPTIAQAPSSVAFRRPAKIQLPFALKWGGCAFLTKVLGFEVSVLIMRAGLWDGEGVEFLWGIWKFRHLQLFVSILVIFRVDWELAFWVGCCGSQQMLDSVERAIAVERRQSWGWAIERAYAVSVRSR